MPSVTALRKGYDVYSKLASKGAYQLIQLLLRPPRQYCQYVKRSRKFRFGPGTMMIHLALDGEVPWAAGSEFRGFNYVHVDPYIDDLARTYTAAVNGVLPAQDLLERY